MFEGPHLERGVDEEAEKREQHQRLDHGALRREEYRDAGDQDLASLHRDLPVVGARGEALVEEAVLLLDFEEVERVAVAEEQEEREERDAHREEKEAHEPER